MSLGSRISLVVNTCILVWINCERSQKAQEPKSKKITVVVMGPIMGIRRGVQDLRESHHEDQKVASGKYCLPCILAANFLSFCN